MPEFRYEESNPLDKKPESSETKKPKKKIKNKWFFIGLIAVVAFVVFQKIRESQSESESGYYSTPLGYSGYPDSVGGSVATDTSYVDSALDSMGSSINDALESIYKDNEQNIKNLTNEWEMQNKAYDTTIDQLSSQLDAFSDKYEKVVDVVDKQNETIQTQNIITMMKENSDKALITKSQSEKDYLHKLNEQYADSIGATFNDSDGYWYKDGKRLYSTSLQSSYAEKNSDRFAIHGDNFFQYPTVDRSAVLKQMEQNSKAYKSATDSQKKSLYLENQSLGKSIGLSYDSASGKWKNTDGSDAWNYNQSAYTGSSSTNTVKASSPNSSGNYVKVTDKKGNTWIKDATTGKAPGLGVNVKGK